MANKIDENRNNQKKKKLWQQLKNLGYNSKGKQSCNIVFDIDDETCFDLKKVANCFNTFFTNIDFTFVSKRPASWNLFDTGSYKFRDFYQNRNVQQDGFALTSVGEDFIYKELCKLSSSKGTGSDNIPARFVKDAASVLKKKTVIHIVNLSIQTGIVPCELKNARVVLLFKKNKRSDVSNYRPVSVLSVFSKILEKAVYVQLEDYLVNNSLLYVFEVNFQQTHVCPT